MRPRRPVQLCRSWLFLGGANEAVLQRAVASGADVLIQELADFTPTSLRPAARALAPELYPAWREAGAVVAVRVNPLEQDGMEDLAAVMRGRPDIVALPKVAEPGQITRLDEAVARFERDYGIPLGSTALLPNIEFARGLVQTDAIAKASKRTTACLLASEDLAADLGAERGQDGSNLLIAGSASSSNASLQVSWRSIAPIHGATSKAPNATRDGRGVWVIPPRALSILRT